MSKMMPESPSCSSLWKDTTKVCELVPTRKVPSMNLAPCIVDFAVMSLSPAMWGFEGG